MRFPEEFFTKYSVRLESSNTWMPGTPDEIIHYYMGLNSIGGRVLAPGIDPLKQNFLKLNIPIPIKRNEERRVAAILVSFNNPEEMVERFFPKFGIKIKGDKIVAITQALREDYLRDNFYRIKFGKFQDSCLDVSGPYEE